MKLTSGRPGFTLIELLIVVVILGVLATISLYQTDQVSRRANIAAMQADLRAVLMQEELFHNLNLRYATLPELVDFSPTRGVTIDVTWADGESFAATAEHVRLVDNTCAVFFGPAPAGSADPATEPGVITCDY